VEDFFISYAEADCSWAEWVAWQVEHAGFTTILQAWDFRVGTDWALNMKQAAQQSTYTIAILSEDYLKSRNAQKEWAAAFASDRLLPIRVKPVELLGFDKTTIYLDLVNKTEDEAKSELTRLYKGLSGERGPRTPPTYPGSSATVFPGFMGAPPSGFGSSTVTAVHFKVPTALTGGLPGKLNVDFTIELAPTLLLLTFDHDAFGIDRASDPDGAAVKESKSDRQFSVMVANTGAYRFTFSIRAKRIEDANSYLRIILADNTGKEIKAAKHWINTRGAKPRFPWWKAAAIIILAVASIYIVTPFDARHAINDGVIHDYFTDMSLHSKKWSSGAQWSLVNVRVPPGKYDALSIVGKDIGFVRPPRFCNYYDMDMNFVVPITDVIRQKSVDWIVRLQHPWWRRGYSYYRFRLTFPTPVTADANLAVSLFIDGGEVRSLGNRQLGLKPFNTEGSSLDITTSLRGFVFTETVIYNDKCRPPSRCESYNDGRPHQVVFEDLDEALKWGTIGFDGPDDDSLVNIQFLTVTPVKD
jgi:TIR domain